MLSAKSESVRSFHESFYGTPTAEEGRWRRGKKRPPIPKEEPQNEVAVIGVHYRSFDDDSMAAFVNSATALVPWNGDAKLLIDRYDVRHLLQDLTGIRRRRARPPSPDATKEELDYERYRDVEGLENPSPSREDEGMNGNASGGGYQRVGFDYNTGGDQSIQKERVEEAIFSPPFYIPEHLLTKLPTSTKVHQIMAGTAKYVIEHGGQAEIVLRVKQANNPTFGFLMPDHYHHEYFRFLVDHPEHVGIGPTAEQVAAEVAVEVSGEDAEGGLSLLGTAYGDADEDENEEDDGAPLDQATDQVAATEEVPEITDDPPKEHGDGNSDICSASRRSSVMNQATVEGVENAANGAGDSCDVSGGSSFLGSVIHEGSGEGTTVRGTVDPSPGMPEPAPPGTETFGSAGTRIETHDLSGEPQVKASDDGVTSTTESESSKEGQFAEKGQVQETFLKAVSYWDRSWTVESTGGKDKSGMSRMPDYNEEKSHNGEGGMGFDAVLAAVRVATRGHVRAVEDVEAADQLKISNGNEHPELGSDEAVLAAVRAATRGSKLDTPGPGGKGDMGHLGGLGSLHASRGSKLDALGSVVKGDIGQTTGFNGLPATKGLKSDALGSGGKVDIDQAGGLGSLPVSATGDHSEPADGTLNGGGSKRTLYPPLSNGDISLGMQVDHAVVAKVAKAAAVAATEEGDSVEAQLNPVEKRKAERLKRAKLFAAMIKDGTGPLTNTGQGSGSMGLSGCVERQNPSGVLLETKTVRSSDVEPEGRDQRGDASLLVKIEEGEEPLDISSKERRRRVKSKDQEEKPRKHHHKRKKNTEEGGEHSKQMSDTEEKDRDENQDHLREGNKKDRRRGRELDVKEGKSKDNMRSHDSGWMRESRLDHEDDCKENGEGRKHWTHDLEGKRKERKHRYDAEHYNGSSRQGQDLDERESRYWHDSGERRERRQKYDVEQKRHSRHSQDYEEKRYERDPEERHERSHNQGKRRKHRYTPDDWDDRDSKDHEHKSKKRRHSDTLSIDDHTHSERQHRLRQELRDGQNHKKLDAVVHQDLRAGRDDRKEVATYEERPPVVTSDDIPDDIRAKVRAILALM